MFKNPGRKLKGLITVIIVVLMAVSVLSAIAPVLSMMLFFGNVDAGEVLALAIIGSITIFIWWIIGLVWMLKVDMADNLSQVREILESMEQQQQIQVRLQQNMAYLAQLPVMEQNAQQKKTSSEASIQQTVPATDVESVEQNAWQQET